MGGIFGFEGQARRVSMPFGGARVLRQDPLDGEGQYSKDYQHGGLYFIFGKLFGQHWNHFFLTNLPRAVSFREETVIKMPSLQTALPPELANNAIRLYRECLRRAKYIGHRQNNTELLVSMVREQFKKNMHETDPEKIQKLKDDAARGLINHILFEAEKISDQPFMMNKIAEEVPWFLNFSFIFKNTEVAFS
ncbi:hypothetical protein K1719_005710 [Acacia pycnantha]|nr:hypothetical protein K1719_005710 [Acacia pycnantha]